MGKTIVLDEKGVENLGKIADAMTKEVEEKDLEIISASIKDELCNYGYELLTGRNSGDKIPTRKGAHFIHEDLKEAFKNLDVILAHIDGVFNSWANNQTHISDLEDKVDEKDLDNKLFVDSYHVSSFKITGQEESKAVVIGGTKNTVHGDISFCTPKIKLNSSYLYIDDLNVRLATLIDEVEQYMDGKRAPEFEQLGMEFDEPSDDDFTEAKVD